MNFSVLRKNYQVVFSERILSSEKIIQAGFLGAGRLNFFFLWIKIPPAGTPETNIFLRPALLDVESSMGICDIIPFCASFWLFWKKM